MRETGKSKLNLNLFTLVQYKKDLDCNNKQIDLVK